MTSLFNLLESYGLTSKLSAKLYQSGVRDDSNTDVFVDTKSGIFFLNKTVDDDTKYVKSGWMDDNKVYRSKDSSEKIMDTNRRQDVFRWLYLEKNILDFGCGDGTFLKAVSPFTKSAVGVELNQEQRLLLAKKNIDVFETAGELEPLSLDTVFLFHSFHYLTKPDKVLKALHNALRPDGHIVIEVPNANDFLLQGLNSQKFREFTFSSEAMIMHNRQSIEKFMFFSGFDILLIKDIQRYGISNHIQWMVDGRPGGHKSIYNNIFDSSVDEAYANALCKAGFGDTLICIGQKLP